MTFKSVNKIYTKTMNFLQYYYESYKFKSWKIYYHEEQIVVKIGYDYISWKGKHSEGRCDNKKMVLKLLDNRIKHVATGGKYYNPEEKHSNIQLTDETIIWKNPLSFLVTIMFSTWLKSGWIQFEKDEKYPEINCLWENKTDIPTGTGLLVKDPVDLCYLHVWLPDKKEVFNIFKELAIVHEVLVEVSTDKERITNNTTNNNNPNNTEWFEPIDIDITTDQIKDLMWPDNSDNLVKILESQKLEKISLAKILEEYHLNNNSN